MPQYWASFFGKQKGIAKPFFFHKCLLLKAAYNAELSLLEIRCGHEGWIGHDGAMICTANEAHRMHQTKVQPIDLLQSMLNVKTNKKISGQFQSRFYKRPLVGTKHV